MAATKIFISYSRDDAKWRQLICKQLQILEREGLIELWDDQRLRAGDDWRSLLYEAVRSAHVAVLMISPSFLTSDFILEEEVHAIMKRCEREGGTVIYPLLIRPCPYEEVDWLAKKQLRPAVPRVKALSTFRGSRREEITADIAREIAAIARKRQAN